MGDPLHVLTILVEVGVDMVGFELGLDLSSFEETSAFRDDFRTAHDNIQGDRGRDIRFLGTCVEMIDVSFYVSGAWLAKMELKKL